MATDLTAIVANLESCVVLEGRKVLAVGSGGGQLVGWARRARAVVAVDRDAAALELLVARADAIGVADRFTTVAADFASVREAADLVLFEFCLHEMADPAAALTHADTLAGEVAVIDHAPDSRWAWHANEEAQVARAWAAIEARRSVSVARFQTFHTFASLDELLAKVRSQGVEAERRARPLPGLMPIRIPFGYAVARWRPSPCDVSARCSQKG